jgi:leucyl-tRNA---protein transferase
MFKADFQFINQEFYAAHVTPPQLDALLEQGWRHFGQHFFRYNLGFYNDEIRLVIPLRIRLENFTLSKSQRRVLRKNKDLQTVIRPVEITNETENLFERHKQRFDHGIPDSIYDFLDKRAATVPCETMECAVYRKNELIAVSFFDVSETAASGIYASFAPDLPERGLGILTMLLEINFAVKSGKKFYYQGYAYEGNSFYDYKKRFRALEKFNWDGNWENF